MSQGPKVSSVPNTCLCQSLVRWSSSGNSQPHGAEMAQHPWQSIQSLANCFQPCTSFSFFHGPGEITTQNQHWETQQPQTTSLPGPAATLPATTTSRVKDYSQFSWVVVSLSTQAGAVSPRVQVGVSFGRLDIALVSAMFCLISLHTHPRCPRRPDACPLPRCVPGNLPPLNCWHDTPVHSLITPGVGQCLSALIN